MIDKKTVERALKLTTERVPHESTHWSVMLMAKKAPAGQDIHIILDNLSAHKTPAIKAWVEKNPHIKEPLINLPFLR